MPYCAIPCRSSPICFLFLVDQSGSMIKPFAQESDKTKAQWVADAVNRILWKLVLRSTRGARVVYDECYIGIIGYGNRVGSSLGGALAEQGLVPVSAIASHPLRMETRIRINYDDAEAVVEKFPVWLEAVADGKTPMCEALRQARFTVEEFAQAFPESFPPVVVNITGGEATDGNPEPLAAELRSVASEDGNVLLFNVYVSATSAQPVQYPAEESCLPDDHFSRMLFRMSSPLPHSMLLDAYGTKLAVPAGARGFVFNADPVSVEQFINIETIYDVE